MNISLTPKLEGFVKAKVKTGDYNNASEVIREALRVLQEREADRKVQLRALRRLIREGEESGPPVSWDPEAIKDKARARVRKRG
ncbi:type II toxin-antitoxin system ParD family antitoxin [Reyranella soli]|uniref:CopG family transcriptional regulator n=1 Tax=Reyranella soli TaxID=1230389 RepID=A0A512NB32_9HYPH|nr:type II toxin-antitoxin system ParD family antitoxin [Reyranella soli]GEP56145.1 CopG family transcriptional regulator [Reyranella soli]